MTIATREFHHFNVSQPVSVAALIASGAGAVPVTFVTGPLGDEAQASVLDEAGTLALLAEGG